MLLRKIILGVAFVGMVTTSFASGPVEIGTISLDYVGQSSNDGTFEWLVHGTSVNLFTYCFSTNNYFNPGENPQVFNVWSIAGSTAAQVTSSGMLSNNYMPGLTTTNFLEAAAQAVSFGTPGISDPVDTVKNAAIHKTESGGNASFSGWDNLGVSNFYYLQEANPTTYGYGGQPQGFVGGPPPVQTTPEPASLAAIGIGAMGLLRRKRR